MDAKTEGAAKVLVDALTPRASGKLPAELLHLDAATVGVLIDIDGVDYILTLSRVPAQRPRPTEQ